MIEIPEEPNMPFTSNSDILQYTNMISQKSQKVSRSPSIEENPISYVTVDHNETLTFGEEFSSQRSRKPSSTSELGNSSITGRQGNPSITYAKVDHKMTEAFIQTRNDVERQRSFDNAPQ